MQDDAPYATLDVPCDSDHNSLDAGAGAGPSDSYQFELRNDFLHFDEILWLGGPHDGYQPHSTSLSAYVWIRRSTSKTRREYFALWQSALSFGVLEAITGLKIPESLLLSPRADGTLVITSGKVSELISHWLFARPMARDTRWIVDWLNSAQRVVGRALQALDEEWILRRASQATYDRDIGLSSDELDNILTSLITLSQWLFVFVMDAILNIVKADTMDLDHVPRVMDWNMNTHSGKVLSYIVYRRKLLGKGWCPYTVPLAVSTFLPGYANTLAPFFRSSPTEHAECTDFTCVTHNLNPTQYVTQHAPESPCSGTGPSCPILTPPITDVYQMLSLKKIPVIVLNNDQTLSVRNADDGPYMAISHVWADGLGSTTEAGLPMCQISRIAGYSRKLVPDGAFWVDSLCVPERKDLRKDAIRLMAETYRRAHAVVVLDAGIRSLCTSTTPLKEVALRIERSAWMQRVWTLQEAVLAKALHFEFADGLTPMTQLQEAFTTALTLRPSSLGCGVAPEPLLQRYAGALLNMSNVYPMGTWFGDTLRMLQKRTTSKPEDETIAVAGLFGVVVARLLEEDDADARMKVFLLELKTLPTDLVFDIRVRPSDRLRFAGFRWAPRTLTRASAGSQRGYMAAFCTPEGLTTEGELSLITFCSDFPLIERPVDTGGVLFNELIVFDSDRRMPWELKVRSRWDYTPQYKPKWNGIITSSHLIRDTTPASLHFYDAAAVHIATSDKSQFSDNASKQPPVVCEYLFPAVLVPAGLEGPIRQWQFHGDAPSVGGTFTLARITVT